MGTASGIGQLLDLISLVSGLGQLRMRGADAAAAAAATKYQYEVHAVALDSHHNDWVVCIAFRFDHSPKPVRQKLSRSWIRELRMAFRVSPPSYFS